MRSTQALARRPFPGGMYLAGWFVDSLPPRVRVYAVIHPVVITWLEAYERRAAPLRPKPILTAKPGVN